MSDRDLSDRYENIRKALAMGPTPGPWGFKELPRDIQRYGYKFAISRGGLGWWIAKVTNEANGGTGAANAAYIAACDPDTIRALLAERDALRAERDELAEQLRLATIAEALAEAEANDAVIAAAPDLLALSKAYASECEICGGSGRLRGDGWQKPCDACADIRAVISRAEGRSDE